MESAFSACTLGFQAPRPLSQQPRALERPLVPFREQPLQGPVIESNRNTSELTGSARKAQAGAVGGVCGAAA